MDALAGEDPCVHGSRQSGDVARSSRLLLLGSEAMELLAERPEDEVEVIAWQIIQKELHLCRG
jgi:hypothetical protein